jgi:hypothetical protein
MALVIPWAILYACLRSVPRRQAARLPAYLAQTVRVDPVEGFVAGYLLWMVTCWVGAGIVFVLVGMSLKKEYQPHYASTDRFRNMVVFPRLAVVTGWLLWFIALLIVI